MPEPPRLTTKQVSFLRSRAHGLEPQLKLGKHGDTAGLRKELEQALVRHELVKLRLGKFVEVDVEVVADEVGAALVQKLGHVAVLYRPAEPPRLKLPEE
ncbi:MAG: YhbY family RNA-binding protein [Planctomycetes bacterium]|nr:YhbY family RNA-binding protein [Planctomycetota bacterium]